MNARRVCVAAPGVALGSRAKFHLSLIQVLGIRIECLAILARLGRSKGDEAMAYVIVQPCIDVKDASCVNVCPVDCIYEGENQYFIHPDECIDCGACEPECPVEAIFADDSVPEQWGNFVSLNRVFFGL